jgi:hypothetical protein
MTNKEKLAQMDTAKLADWLCDIVMPMIANKAEKLTESSYIVECDVCPVRVLCKRGSNGFRTWLEKEAKG